MTRWSACALAMAAVMQWGVVQAQNDAGEAIVPPSPQPNQNQDQDQNQATPDQPGQERQATNPDNQSQANQQQSSQNQSDQGQDKQNQQAQNQANQAQQDQMDQPQSARDVAPAPGELAGRGQAQDRSQQGESQLNRRVEQATANLDISDETRARYRLVNGQWWFHKSNGSWAYFRNGQWREFNPTTFRPIAGSGSAMGRETFAQPAPGTGTVYSTGYRFGGRQFNERPRRARHFRGNRFDNRYDRRFYDPATNQYYRRGPAGRTYSTFEGVRHRAGRMGRDIGGRIGGEIGADIGGAVGAGAAD